MSVKLTIINNPKKNINREIKITNPREVIEINEIKSIRNAMREHLFFIGLDNKNNVKNISLLGIGTTHNVIIDTKEIIRTALLTASEKVILVHNHPANSIEPSKEDRHISNVSNKMLAFYGIQMVDHIIVTKDDYLSLESQKQINHRYIDNGISIMEKGLLIEENEKLKEQLNELKIKNEILETKLNENETKELDFVDEMFDY